MSLVVVEICMLVVVPPSLVDGCAVELTAAVVVAGMVFPAALVDRPVEELEPPDKSMLVVVTATVVLRPSLVVLSVESTVPWAVVVEAPALRASLLLLSVSSRVVLPTVISMPMSRLTSLGK